MKKISVFLSILWILSLFSGCSPAEAAPQIAATTAPVCQFTEILCQDTNLTVTRLITESVSCLHDYTLQVSQMRAAEASEVIILSGAGLEEFMGDWLDSGKCIDSSADVPVISLGEDHAHQHEHGHEHNHEHDPHIWLSPINAKMMAQSICSALAERYPADADTIKGNLPGLLSRLDALQAYGEENLSHLTTQEMITFHDGFAYFADCFGLTILEAVEEESGSEASAQELKHLIHLVEEHNLPAIFIEVNGSSSAASVISRETGAKVFTLDMAMAGDDYFESMYHNIDTIKEALG